MIRALTAVLIGVCLGGAPAPAQVSQLVNLTGVSYSGGRPAFSYSPKTNFTKVPFETVRGMILVQAEIEGRRGNFILDTGAPTLIVNGENAEGGPEEWQGVSGDYSARPIRVGQFAWAGIEKSGIEAIALDISHLEEEYQRELLGVIGYQIFSDREILVDARNMQIFIFSGEDNQLSRLSQPLASYSFNMQGHLPVIKARAGAAEYLFGFDSGCTANLLDEKTMAGLPAEAVQVIRHQQVQGFGQQVQAVPVLRTAAIEVEGLPSAEMDFLVMDLSHLQESDVKIDGLLGYPFFKNLTFSINYNKRRLSIWKIHPGEAEMMP